MTSGSSYFPPLSGPNGERQPNLTMIVVRPCKEVREFCQLLVRHTNSIQGGQKKKRAHIKIASHEQCTGCQRDGNG